MYADNIVHFVPDHGIAAQRAQEEEFLAQLDEFNKQGWYVSYQAASRHYAPRVFSCGNGKRKLYEKAMRRLFEQQRIHIETYGKPSRGLARIVRTAVEVEIIDFPRCVG